MNEDDINSFEATPYFILPERHYHWNVNWMRSQAGKPSTNTKQLWLITKMINCLLQNCAQALLHCCTYFGYNTYLSPLPVTVRLLWDGLIRSLSHYRIRVPSELSYYLGHNYNFVGPARPQGEREGEQFKLLVTNIWIPPFNWRVFNAQCSSIHVYVGMKVIKLI